jgi:uncharacterized membrane protein YhhN
VTILQKILLGIFLASAVLFISLLTMLPYPADFVLKAMPAASLAVLAFLAVSGLKGKLLSMSLLFCAAADMVLLLAGGKYFIIGLGLFLIAHLLFLITFSRDIRARKSQIPIILMVILYALLNAFVIAPYLKEMAIPVYIYMAVLALMVVFAAMRVSKNDWTLYGAIVFMVSDTMLAINKFMRPVPAVDYLCMTTYFLALFLIVFGYLKN